MLGFAEPRLEGVRQTCADLGLAEPVVQPVPLDPAEAAEAVRAWHDADPTVTGIAAYNDEVALAVLAGARRRGLEVPGDLAVIGVDDLPVAALSRPSLTTVRADLEAMSRYIADSIARKLDGRPPARRPGSDIHTVIRRDSA